MINIILPLLFILLILLLAFIITSNAIFNKITSNAIFNNNNNAIKKGGNKIVNKLQIVFNKVSTLPATVDDIYGSKAINLVDEPDVVVLNEFWAFYPLVNYQIFMFKSLSTHNPYMLKLYSLPQFQLYKHYIDKMRIDVFNNISNNFGIFTQFHHFLLPNLKYLRIGNDNAEKTYEAMEFDDYELLQLYRLNNLSKKGTMVFDRIKTIADRKDSTYDIVYVYIPCFKWSIVKNYDYTECYSMELLRTILNLSHILKKTSLVIILIPFFNSLFMVDIITLLQYYFDRVEIIQTVVDSPIFPNNTPYKVICTHYLFKHIDPKLTNIVNSGTIPTNDLFPIRLFKTQNEETINILKMLISTSIMNRSMEIKSVTNLINEFKALNTEIERDNFINFIQENEKIKALQIFNLLNIKPLFTLIFNHSHIDMYMNYDKSLLVELNNDNDQNNDNNFENLLVIHKSYLDRINFKEFKELDNLLRITKLLKIHIKNKKVSQAYFKMLEILEDNQFYKTLSKISAFHICEAPGQFIQAFTHFCNKYKLKYVWKAQTLRPDSTNTALHDTYGYIKNNPNSWLYGKDNTGDITSIANILSYEERSKRELYNFITSDCGIGFSNNYNAQEAEIEFINYCQFMTMLLCLQPNGVTAMKVFLPLTRPLSIFMVTTLLQHFKNVIYFKPSLNLTSSEIYIVCKNYNGITTKLREELLNIYKMVKNGKVDDLISANNLNISSTLQKKYYNGTYKMIINTIKGINKYLFFYYYMNEQIRKKMIYRQKQAVQKWIHTYF